MLKRFRVAAVAALQYINTERRSVLPPHSGLKNKSFGSWLVWLVGFSLPWAHLKWLPLVSPSHLASSSLAFSPLCFSAMPPFLDITTIQSNATVTILALPATITKMPSRSRSSSLKAKGLESSLLTRGSTGGETLVSQMAQPCMYAKQTHKNPTSCFFIFLAFEI